MSIEHQYIVHLIRLVRVAVQNELGEDAAYKVARIEQRLLSSVDLQKSLNELYQVAGFDKFALLLSWLKDFVRIDSSFPNEDVTKLEAERLVSLIRPSLISISRSGQNDGLENLPEEFDVALFEFGRAAERAAKDELKNRSENLALCLEAAERVQSEALRAGRSVVVEIMQGLVTFIRWVTQHQVEDSVRVFGIINATNITLQTSQQVNNAEYDEAIQHTLDLLQNPERILGYTHMKVTHG